MPTRILSPSTRPSTTAAALKQAQGRVALLPEDEVEQLAGNGCFSPGYGRHGALLGAQEFDLAVFEGNVAQQQAALKAVCGHPAASAADLIRLATLCSGEAPGSGFSASKDRFAGQRRPCRAGVCTARGDCRMGRENKSKLPHARLVK